MQARTPGHQLAMGPRFFDLPVLLLYGRRFVLGLGSAFRQKAIESMKVERHDAIRELVGSSLIQSQDELRKKLRRRGFAVTQATLSRDLQEMQLFKGAGGYGFAASGQSGRNGNGHGAAVAEDDDDSPPGVAEVLETFGLRSQQAMNQVVIGTVMGGAQPVAAALDYEEWPEVLGTIAGDDTVLVICIDVRRAAEAQARLKKMLES